MAVIPWNPISIPTSIRDIPIGTHFFPQTSFKIHNDCRFSRNYGKSFNFYASSSSNGNELETAAAYAAKEYDDDEFIVVNFYRFVYIQDPQEEVSKHLYFIKVSLSLSLCYYFFGLKYLCLFCNLSSLMLFIITQLWC